ncbi:hypothetical protein LV779_22065 [Streptomyces thinghirensis]|nr:hypothetical protein [Streptomyces thinghirensis]
MPASCCAATAPPFDGRSGDEPPGRSPPVSSSPTARSERGRTPSPPRGHPGACRNGLTSEQGRHARRGHLGGKQDEGVISWSGQTQRKTLGTDHVQDHRRRTDVPVTGVRRGEAVRELEDAAG